MLFHSYAFLLVFLPLVAALHLALVKAGVHRAVLPALGLASLVFYGWGQPQHVPLLCASLVVNAGLARALQAQCQRGREGTASALLALGVAFNLGLLAVFKYGGLLGLNSLLGAPLALPVGISFYCFTQLAYLVDVRRGQVVDLNPVRYGLFVTWFPHLVAGPVLHHAQVMPQFERAQRRLPRAHDVAAGLSLFTLGLLKKIALADPLAPWVHSVFEAAQAGAPLSAAQAWGGVLAYSLQLYFDFSGYSDMACGLSRCFGVRLPLNFFSPYRAGSIREFWRRWHITLSRFLQHYLYIPLGGNRHGAARRVFSLMATMLLGGLWHGAAITFVLWGGLHGLYLVLHQAWRAASQGVWGGAGLPTALAWPLTLLAVAWAWVPFRASSVEAAVHLWQAMLGLAPASALNTSATAWPLGAPSEWALATGALAAALALAAPNSAQLFGPRLFHGLPASWRSATARRWRWAPRARWAWALGLGLVLCLAQLHRESPFLYFQF